MYFFHEPSGLNLIGLVLGSVLGPFFGSFLGSVLGPFLCPFPCPVFGSFFGLIPCPVFGSFLGSVLGSFFSPIFGSFLGSCSGSVPHLASPGRVRLGECALAQTRRVSSGGKEWGFYGFKGLLRRDWGEFDQM